MGIVDLQLHPLPSGELAGADIYDGEIDLLDGVGLAHLMSCADLHVGDLLARTDGSHEAGLETGQGAPGLELAQLPAAPADQGEEHCRQQGPARDQAGASSASQRWASVAIAEGSAAAAPNANPPQPSQVGAVVSPSVTLTRPQPQRPPGPRRAGAGGGLRGWTGENPVPNGQLVQTRFVHCETHVPGVQ